jgi:predicted transcriptional regulator
LRHRAGALCDHALTMTEVTPLQGELQTQIMAAIWRLQDGTVEQVRQALPPHHQGAYNTVQTVLNRLAERGLLSRRREGHVIVYAPRLTEAEYLSRSMEHTLRGASSEARQVALAQLIGALPRSEAAELGRLAEEVAAERMR